jgi:hypothetical protein
MRNPVDAKDLLMSCWDYDVLGLASNSVELLTSTPSPFRVVGGTEYEARLRLISSASESASGDSAAGAA